MDTKIEKSEERLKILAKIDEYEKKDDFQKMLKTIQLINLCVQYPGPSVADELPAHKDRIFEVQ